MAEQTHSQIINFIWGICNLLRGPYKRNEYRKVILPLTVLRRFDCVLEPTKEKVLAAYPKLKGKSEIIISAKLNKITGLPFYNHSELTFKKLLDDSNQIAANLNGYIDSFSSNVREIFHHFDFGIQIAKMKEKNLLYQVIKKFCSDEIDLSPATTDNLKMGEIFEELIRIGAEQSNEEAGEHFTPREVIQLMVNLLLSPEQGLRKSHVVKTIYDPACGTGGMFSAAEKYIKTLNAEAQPHLYGQDAKGNPEPDAELRDTENVPLKEDIDDYFKREVVPYVPDAWIDRSKTKVGYEIPLNRFFYCYEPPRALEEIEQDILELEGEIITMLSEITGSTRG